MRRKSLEQRVQNGRGALLPGERRIRLGRGRDQRQRIVNGDFGVVREIAIDARQGVGVGLQPAAVGRGIVAAIEGRRRRNEPLLARRGRAQGGGALGCRRAAARAFAAGGSTSREWIAPRIQRETPVPHRAGRIGRDDGLERTQSLLPPEGVQVGHRALEFPLRRGIAGCWERDPTELVLRRQRPGETQGDDDEASDATHERLRQKK